MYIFMSALMLAGTTQASMRKQTVLTEPLLLPAAPSRRNIDLEPHLKLFPTKRVSNQFPQLQRLARLLKFHLKQVYMFLSKKRMTKALIRLRGCAGWSAPVLFANPRRQIFSRRGLYYGISPKISCTSSLDKCRCKFTINTRSI